MAMNRGSKQKQSEMNERGKNWTGAKQTERGQDVDEGSGHGRQRVKAGTTQPAEQSTAGRHSQRILRPAQASKQTATDGRPRSETTAADQHRPASRRAGKWGGVQWYWQP